MGDVEKIVNERTVFRFESRGMKNRITIGGEGISRNSVMGVFSDDSVGCDVFPSQIKCDVKHGFLKMGDVMVFLNEKTLMAVEAFLKAEFKTRGFTGC